VPANFDTGFFHREPAWHGLGVVVDTPPATWDEARKLAGLDWEPITSPIKGRDLIPSGVTAEGDPIYQFNRDIPGWEERIRSDTGATLYVGPTSYELITNSDMGLIMDVIMGDERRHFETAGVLEGGRKVWCLVELGDPIEIPGDPSPTKRYVAILNSHDGQTSCKAVATCVRVVCANTWHAAEADAAKSEACYTFRHSSGWRAKLDEVAKEAQAAVRGAQAEVDEYRMVAERLLGIRITRLAEARFVDEFVFPTKDEHRLGKRALANVVEDRKALRALLDSETCEGIRGTAYGLMQAGGEWADHVRGFETRETLFGRSVINVDKFKKRAHRLALAAAAGDLD
jgi:phage/plasmid-like protein (TIGR03299 family)